MNEFGSNVERYRHELLVHCYRMLGSLQDAEDAVQEMLLRAWRYRDNPKEGAPLRPWLYRVATNVCLDAIARDERRAVLAARAAADDGWVGKPDDVVWLRPIPDSVLEPPTPPERSPEAILSLDVPKELGMTLARSARGIRANLLIIISPQDHMVNPTPAMKIAADAGFLVLTLNSACGHLSLTCVSVRPTVARFLVDPSSVHSATLQE